MYDVIASRGLLKDDKNQLIFHRNVGASAFAGIVGSVIGSPFFLVKTHIQAQAAKEIAFGHQHNHEGMMQGLRNIYKEHGVRVVDRTHPFLTPLLF